MRFPRGLTTTTGISIIALAIVIVGVAIYFVYTNTQSTQTDLTITLADRLVAEAGVSSSVTGSVSSGQSGSITLSITTPDSISAELSSTSVTPGDSFTVTIFGESETADADVVVRAEQGTRAATHHIAVKIFSDVAPGNTNGATNLNANTINTENLNSNTSHVTDNKLIDAEFNISMEYPSAWGNVFIPQLVRHAPSEGAFHYAYFTNIQAEDIPGRVYVTAASTDYVPVSSTGTPFWFTSAISPTASIGHIEEQFRASGIEPLHVEKIKLDGRDAVRAYGYFGVYSHYISIIYLVPFQALLSPYETLMLMRTVDVITTEDLPVESVYAAGRALAQKLENEEGSEQAQRRLLEFDDTVQNLQFIQ